MTTALSPLVSIDVPKKRFGLVPAKVGASLPHKLGVPLDLSAPIYPTDQPGAPRLRGRTRLAGKPAPYATDERGVRTAALPGALVVLEVQDFNRLPDDQTKSVRWQCSHPDCAGEHWTSRADLIRAHGDNRELIDEASRAPDGGHPHLYFGVLEVAGVAAVAETRDGEGKVTTKARPGREAVVMLLSEEL